MNRLSFLFVLGVIATLLAGGTYGYTYVSKERVDENMKKYDLKIASLESDIVQYEGGNIEAALSAKETLDFLGGDMVEWSDVISEILDVAPKNKITRKPVVDFTSYSGSQGNRLSISVRTNSGSLSPYYDVAELIRSFGENPKFKNVFVPAISPGFTEDGSVILTFNLNVEYVPGGEEAPVDLENLMPMPDVEVPEYVGVPAAPSFKPSFKPVN
ncbi:hypothetical protein HOG17_01570 [Candidatus Peregrinibacteria bacterium]|jgi:hypothetical protein|nr:hypothetical protein [Candidatus Peregrinibacteria bacterium]MBT4148422.1 hypothetical protein [Candidatus Peregrinibacteria bacterium]MBT4366481.1 hypothetical protein [Candidatus Peregrinibacteria bacterium]MBT4456068.1 hypothetical protein [Candidatus Peregrinibacteria bacterium]